MNTKFQKTKIAVIGAGTAGCIQVLQFLDKLNEEYFEIDWIYDPEKKIFGIGEATTPHIPSLFTSAGITSDSLINELRGTLKDGVKFFNWGKENKKFVHSFGLNHKGIHFDTSALSIHVLKYIEKRKGIDISVIPEAVKTIESTPSGCIVNDRKYNFVVDCSGNDPLLYEDEYSDTPLQTVDSAIIYRKLSPGKWNHTVHFAHENGWLFGIPLRDRQTWGYTFNSKFTTEEEARKGLQELMPEEDTSMAKYVTWKSRFSNFIIDDNGVYAKNGNAAGFVEPLQSLSGMHTIRISELLCDYLNDSATKKIVNEDGHVGENEWLIGVAYHYQVGSTFDTPFWNTTMENAKLYLKETESDEELIESILKKNEKLIQRLAVGCFKLEDLLQLAQGLGTQTSSYFDGWDFGDPKTRGSNEYWGDQESIADYLK